MEVMMENSGSSENKSPKNILHRINRIDSIRSNSSLQKNLDPIKEVPEMPDAP